MVCNIATLTLTSEVSVPRDSKAGYLPEANPHHATDYFPQGKQWLRQPPHATGFPPAATRLSYQRPPISRGARQVRLLRLFKPAPISEGMPAFVCGTARLSQYRSAVGFGIPTFAEQQGSRDISFASPCPCRPNSNFGAPAPRSGSKGLSAPAPIVAAPAQLRACGFTALTPVAPGAAAHPRE